MKRKLSKAQLVPLAGEVIRGLRLAKGMTALELAEAAGISKNTVSNIEHGVTQQMQLPNAECVAKTLGVPLDEITIQTSIEAKNPALGALGLVEIPVSGSDEEPFQSLRFSRENQPLAYVWYDYRTESLSLKPPGDDGYGELYLECEFSGGESSMASNFALHPENHTPRELKAAQQQAIGFSARIVKNPGQNPLSLAVRLVDRKGREWVLGSKKGYGQKDQPHLFPLDLKQGWSQCIIYLTPYPTALHTWYLFRTTSADRSPNLRPDWSVISRIVIEIGEVGDIGHPAAREGTIWITPIWLGTPVTLAKRLPSGDSGGKPKTKSKRSSFHGRTQGKGRRKETS